MSASQCIMLYHPDFLKHETGRSHPESPDRLSAAGNYLFEKELCPVTRPEPAGEDAIAEVHSAGHIRRVKDLCDAGGGVLDLGDTVVSGNSYGAALLAAGAGLTAVRLIGEGACRRVFCLVRPPGHHAERDAAMGFCLFNNVAVCARHWLDSLPGRRICIVDWDVHHGNGTQNAFYDSAEVLFVSLHQSPLYPGTGFPEETGEGEGTGFTLNVPLAAGTTGDEYLERFRKLVLPRLHSFQPEAVLVSAGFDAHFSDPLADLKLSEDTFRALTEDIVDVAERHAGGRIISFLEGGYNLEYLPRCIESHLSALL